MLPDYIWLIFWFLMGASVGSFLNVVVYRMPLDLSIVTPGSHCPQCKHALAWYDNIPILTWFYLGGKCRYCKSGYSIQYVIIELLTGIMFALLYFAYFNLNMRIGFGTFEQGAWIIFLAHIILVSILWSSSLIDGEHFIIPPKICYFGVVCGFVISMITPYKISNATSTLWEVTPYASSQMGALAIGATVGLFIALVLVKIKLLPRSFDAFIVLCETAEVAGKPIPEDQLKIRVEMLRELVFLLPVGLGAFIAYVLLCNDSSLSIRFGALISEQKWLAGLLGSLFGFMIGGAVVWGVRITGSLGFNKEAMGLGDVHLMAAVGAVLGWQSATVAFFIAPFFGIAYAIIRLICVRGKEIPYGPFLSAATVLVMLYHDPIMRYFSNAFVRPEFVTPY